MKKIVIVGIALGAVLALLLGTRQGREGLFLVGAGLITAGYELQDRFDDYDFAHHEVTAAQTWDEFQLQNRLSAGVHSVLHRKDRHPVVALVACMDARLDTGEIVGDSRKFYYIIRMAGSVLAPKEEEMLELAVNNGVKLVAFTTHSDCAAEKVARDPEMSRRFPNLTQAINERQMRFEEFGNRPFIRQRVDAGELMVKWLDLDTYSESASEHRRDR